MPSAVTHVSLLPSKQRDATAHALALLTLALLAYACSGAENGRIVDPVYEDPCRFFPADACSGNGECHADAQNEPMCLCALGYEGGDCNTCEPGYHRDARDLCISDRGCDEESAPCGSDGSCVDDLGVLACVCEEGYGGPRCTLCADGYARAATGRCEIDTRGPRPVRPDAGASVTDASTKPVAKDAGSSTIDAGGRPDAGAQSADSGARSVDAGVCTSRVTTTLAFEGLNGWPSADNQCNSSATLVLPEVTLQSRIGAASAYVWLCAKNTTRGMALDTRSIELEAGPTQPAQITFPHHVVSVRFDYAARDAPLSLDVLVADAAVQTIELAQGKGGAFSMQLSSPSASIALRSRSAYRQNIAIDNLAYQYDQCQ